MNEAKYRIHSRHIFILLIVCFLFLIGYTGIDFGYHWDEPKIIRSVARSIETGILLPRWYNYSSVSYTIALLCVAPDAFHSVLQVPKIILARIEKPEKIEMLGRLSASLSKKMYGKAYKLRVRSVFLLVTLLSVVWVYILILKWKESLLEALLGASLFGFSWEVVYHARWIAPDGILMQFAALTALAMLIALKSEHHRLIWLRLAAVGAGLACGTKYPGGALLVPILIMPHVLGRTEDGGAHKINRCEILVLILIFLAVFLATTPGLLIEPFRSLYDVLGEIRHYQSGHAEHTISPGIKHAMLMISYLSFSVFSYYWPIALVLFLFATVGVYYVVRYEPRTAMVLLLAPLVYFLYLATQRVMMARNLLMLIPFTAILSARGIMFCFMLLPNRIFKLSLAIMVVFFLGANASWLVKTSKSIKNRSEINYGRNIIEYLDGKKDKVFFLSDKTEAVIESITSRDISNVSQVPGDADKIIFFSSEVRKWLANRFNLYQIVSGPYEVNFNYYPSWRGDDRVVVADRSVVDELRFFRALEQDDP